MVLEKYSEVLGLPVICVSNGKKIGIIKDMVFSPKMKELKAFLLERRGCQINGKVILLKDVLDLGRDALIVNDCSCAKSPKKVKNTGDLGENGKIKGLKVYTRSGEDMGVVEDVIFDHKTGVVEGVEVSNGLMQDIVQGRNILPLFGKVEFSEENILVDKEAIEEMSNTGGGLKKLLGNERK